jgi:hypothetical protein
MPAIRAERLCPEAIFVTPDFVRYKEVSHEARNSFIAIPISLNRYRSIKPIWPRYCHFQNYLAYSFILSTRPQYLIAIASGSSVRW